MSNTSKGRASSFWADALKDPSKHIKTLRRKERLYANSDSKPQDVIDFIQGRRAYGDNNGK